MSSIPSNASEQPAAMPSRSESIVMGRQDYISTLLRQIGVELYKIRRRAMSKVLSIIALLILLVVFVFFGFLALSTVATPASTYLPPQCSSDANPTITCLDHQPTQEDLQQAEQIKQDSVRASSAYLRPPTSFTTALGAIRNVGIFLIIILAGTIMGGEYGAGTIRHALTRGPSRTQFFLAKLGAILVCVTLALVVLLAVGIITGALLNLPTGIGIDFGFFTVRWLSHALLLILIVIFGQFLYGLLAVCFATLGKATAAGIAAGLIWWALEPIATSIFTFTGTLNNGAYGNFWKQVPDYFISNSISVLIQNQMHYLEPGTELNAISDVQAILVLAAYCVVLALVAWFVTLRRDITN